MLDNFTSLNHLKSTARDEEHEKDISGERISDPLGQLLCYTIATWCVDTCRLIMTKEAAARGRMLVRSYVQL